MGTTAVDVYKYRAAIAKSLIKRAGRVERVAGLTIESVGPDVPIGSRCLIRAGKRAQPVPAEVVGFGGSRILLMPLGDISGIGPGSAVEASDEPLSVTVSDALLGRVLDGLGAPSDGKSAVAGVPVPIANTPPDPMERARITDPLPLGVRALDGLITVAKGQRIGIFAGSGVGKSTLMGMIARNTRAGINVIALIGERGREVKEFIEKDLGEEGLARSVLVVATSDKPALIRLKAAETATAIAEYFRAGGRDVLLMMDSLTRYAMAQREVGLATGEPPVSRGYTPSVYAALPKLLERAGKGAKGSITGIYTVLVDGDDLTEPVTDTSRGILDGHIVLSRKLANRNHYPAIDVLASVSRVMGDVASDGHKAAAREIKRLMAVYADAEDLINIGAYAKGASAEIDEAVAKNAGIKAFLTQRTDEKADFGETVERMEQILKTNPILKDG
ncbi:MAG: flagellar protein export ATPase FliI [Clostridiales bacterium]|nr:flagellar protein export ATPase FliI [Clostridiales bacterium]